MECNCSFEGQSIIIGKVELQAVVMKDKNILHSAVYTSKLQKVFCSFCQLNLRLLNHLT